MADIYVCIKDLLAASREIFNSISLLSNSTKCQFYWYLKYVFLLKQVYC